MQAKAQGQPVNWNLGLRALLGALALGAISSRYGSPLPLYAAFPVGGWALFKPLRLGAWLFSRQTLRFLGSAALRTAGLAGAAFVLSFVVNSSLPVLQLAGTVLFLALIGIVLLTVGRALWTAARRWTPRAWSLSGGALERLQLQAAWVRFSLTGR